ncbi:chymotrypsin family serine protease [Sphaerisporangium rhizosphaerae]|uniref:Streptogrisin C n=1 Tax=Sphaerisporangium rhizosphaerae TaxID=2269375 RepID=A0ABW2P8I0_9ACTN
MAAGQAAAAPAPSPVKDTTARPIEPAGAVPGGFASWKDLLATQEKLVKAADRITAAVKAQGGAGFAGIVAAPENHELRVYWKGNAPRHIGNLVGQVRREVPVSVLPAAYSARELEREMNRLVRRSPDAITAIAPNVDGSGLTVSGVDSGLTRSKVADSAVPVTVEAGVKPTLATRWDDSPPWWGGGAWRNANTGGGCSTGFAVTYGGTSRMLSAGHCGDAGQTATDPTGQVIGSISPDNNGLDVLLINGTSAGRVFNNNVGSTSPEFSNPVIGTTSSYVGLWVCTSGAYSGTNCSIQVQQVGVTINVGYLITGTVRAEQSAHTNAVGQGDSGGSVEVVNPSNTLQVYAAGVNTAIDGSTAVACTGYVTSGRTCAWRMYYSPWSNATAAFPGIAIVLG